MQVKKIMTRRVITATEDMEIEEAAALMLKEGIARLPVIRGKKLIGIITREDIIHAIGSTMTVKEGGEA
jgi:CBS domain-containing protein